VSSVESFEYYDKIPYKAYVIDTSTNDVVYMNSKIKDVIYDDNKCIELIYSLDSQCSYCNINHKVDKSQIDEKIYDVYSKITNKWYQITQKIDIKGNKTYKHSIAIDITSYKIKDIEKERLLQESRLSAMSEMIDMLSHQWRQPLTAININAQSIKFKNHINKLTSENIDMLSDSIVKVVKELSDTITDFNYISKVSTKKYDILVNEQIQKVLEINSESIKENGIKVVLDLDSTKPIHSYKRDMIQVILRIFTNAIESFEKDNKNRVVTIKSFDTLDSTQVDIIDNGCGIDKEVLPKIFEPYFSTKSYNKKGLGLYFAKVLATEHLNADIKVSTESGTKFSIILNR
jgi:signal transduction histidine kinase